MRVLAVLALVVGISAMHSVTADHGSHAAAAHVTDVTSLAAHDRPHETPPRQADLQVAGAPCDLSCAPSGNHIADLCLAVLGGVGGLALLLLAPTRRRLLVEGSPGPSTRLVTFRGSVVAHPPRPPSPLLICVSRT